MRSVRIPFFRIWYSTTYTIVFAILLIFLCATPGDIVYQSYRAHRIPNIFVVGGCYILTAVLVLLIYSTRLYTNRSVLAAIPKSYVPVEVGEVGKGVRRMIVKQLERSAIIAWDARPRDLRAETEESAPKRPSTVENHSTKTPRRHTTSPADAIIMPASVDAPSWGHIAHPGWSSPASPDLPNLQFWQVLLELPNLIEAKAVSLAPLDPVFNSADAQTAGRTPIPDAQIVALLQRPIGTSLRDYLSHLSSLGLINPPVLATRFLTKYEHARFSSTAIAEPAFRDLMRIFADILAGMAEPRPEYFESFGYTNYSSGASADSASTTSSSGSVRHHAMLAIDSASSSSLESLATVMHSWHSAR